MFGQLILFLPVSLPTAGKYFRHCLEQLLFPLSNLVRMNLILAGQFSDSFIAFDCSQSHFGLECGTVIPSLVLYNLSPETIIVSDDKSTLITRPVFGEYYKTKTSSPPKTIKTKLFLSLFYNVFFGVFILFSLIRICFGQSASKKIHEILCFFISFFIFRNFVFRREIGTFAGKIDPPTNWFSRCFLNNNIS